MARIEYVNVEEAGRLILKMTEKIDEPKYKASMDQLQKEMKELVHGMILTAIETGLIENKPERLEELRSKLTVALCSGFILGKEGLSCIR